MNIAIALVTGAAGLAVGMFFRHVVAGRRTRELDARLRHQQEEHDRELARLRAEAGNADQERRRELTQSEERIHQREMAVERKTAFLEQRELALDRRADELVGNKGSLDQRDAELRRSSDELKARLETIARLTSEEARTQVLAKTRDELQGEIGGMIRRAQEEAKEQAERLAQKVVSEAIQRCTLSHSTESMTTTVAIPGEEMKGRVIGREGRNIKALEAATGVTIVIDETPDVIVVSAFDPVRRESARRVLTRLIEDGRIHPARIEEVVAKVNEEMAEAMREAGEAALIAADVPGVPAELTRVLGRLTFRTSYTQNVLKHSIEVARLMGVMASEMGIDPVLARRIGLFHDIGKALDHEIEGPHAVIGADLLRRHGETAVVVNGVGAHHEDAPVETVYAVLASAADAISGSRLGARSENTQTYVKRLERLEEIAKSFPGVLKTFAIQAGREIRVVVEPGTLDDEGSLVLARDVARKIEDEVQYPGQIRVVVIRETRAVEYAK